MATGEALSVMPNPDIVLGAAFDPSGTRIGHLLKNRVIFRPVFPTVEELLAAAKARALKIRTGVGVEIGEFGAEESALFERTGASITDIDRSR